MALTHKEAYRIDPKIRFMDKVKKTDSCWLWMARLDKKGYGRFNFDGSMKLAHRVSYQLFKGELRNGLDICHECHNPRCVNPAHLTQETRSYNIKQEFTQGRRSHAGDNSNRKKLNQKSVEKIRTMLAAGKDLKEIANQFGVVVGAIYNIKSGRSWATK